MKYVQKHFWKEHHAHNAAQLKENIGLNFTFVYFNGRAISFPWSFVDFLDLVCCYSTTY